MRQWIIGCAAMLMDGAAGAQIFECIDAKGNREFAQTCPPGTVKETRLLKGGAGPAAGGGSSAPASKSLAEQDAAFRKRSIERQEAEAEAAKQQAESEEAKRNCFDARAQLKQLQDGTRLSRTNPDTGERTFLDDSQRQTELVNAQKAVDNWCNKK